MQWYPVSWIGIDLNYTYVKIDYDRPASDVLDDGGFIENATPNHLVTLRTSMDFTDQWQFNFWLRWQDSTRTGTNLSFFNPETTIDSFATVDANIRWRPSENLEVVLSGQNLLDNRQLQYVAEIFTAPTKIDRNVQLKLTWTF